LHAKEFQSIQKRETSNSNILRSRENQTTRFGKHYRNVPVWIFYVFTSYIHFYPMSLCTSTLKDCFDCRNNASKKTNHQAISNSVEAKGTRGRRGFLPSGRKTVRICSKAEPFIKTSTKNIFTQPLTFGDIEESLGNKEVLPH
jgi:hypothetical protein